ncbi:TetR/AcrR family transcriptional regulator [Lactobacillus sp. PV034]|uniref:TetR/AcrR family transcriptional regulator n=1 Tax=Lactobacillus sp. PV034 TaxID=2594495 RepID=UPI00223F2350|nr:TetR/AcrR family transcriptional regulator [Lactobacillus sp. PV034]QNQ81243.1 TetR/AcrR family transcriptional regulator [Lactobacillus sp. PV034]
MVKSTFHNLSDEKKKRVSEALLREFSEYPLAQAQVARIVKDAQIARGAFYKYFDDLEDAYTYIYGQAMQSIHLGVGKMMHKFDEQAFYQMTVSFIEETSNSKYYELIKLHLSCNDQLIHSNRMEKSRKTLPLNAQIWSAMILSHEVVNLVLFDPENKEKYLERYKTSLNLLKSGD